MREASIPSGGTDKDTWMLDHRPRKRAEAILKRAFYFEMASKAAPSGDGSLEVLIFFLENGLEEERDFKKQ